MIERHEIIEQIASDDERRFVEILKHEDGSYSLRRFVRRFDPDEDAHYVVRELPDPPSRFADLSSAKTEARRHLGMCA